MVHCTARYCSDCVWLERFIVLLVATLMVCALNGSLYCSLLLWLCVPWTVHCTARCYSDGVCLERFIVLLFTTLIVCGLNSSLYCLLLLWLCVAWMVHCTARYCSDSVCLERFIVLLVNKQYNEPFKSHIIRAVTSSTMNRSSHTPSEQ
jgi:hypothetical protein